MLSLALEDASGSAGRTEFASDAGLSIVTISWA
jgi:hypothetical protein